MMLHKINFEISTEKINLSEDEYYDTINILLNKMHEKNQKGLSFEELSEIIPLDKFKFYPASIDFPDLERVDPNTIITKETKVVIKA